MSETIPFEVIDTHVHVRALDDTPGHRPDPDARISIPNAAVPVGRLIQDMEQHDIANRVLVRLRSRS